MILVETRAYRAANGLFLALLCLAGCDGGGGSSTTAPAITAHPSDQTVLEGESATFTVVATGSGTLTYQWKEDEVNVTGGTGGTTASYTTPAATLADNGALFTCVVSNADGSVTSNGATLTVTRSPFTGTYVVVDLITGSATETNSIPDLLTNDAYKTTKLVLKRIPAGSFQMGDQTGDGNSWELPVHTVNITQAFYMGVFEVTQRQWFEVQATWPSWFTTTPDKRPVECVSCDDCQGFLAQLSSQTGLACRLPTEAEWEYSCKVGTSTNYSYGNMEDEAYMWYDANSGLETHEVGTKQPNPWGLYDMHGNVWEWCEDWYDSGYYSISPSNDPQGPASGGYRVWRGGSWGNLGTRCRSAHRGGSGAASGGTAYGFRVAVVAAPGP